MIDPRVLFIDSGIIMWGGGGLLGGDGSSPVSGTRRF